MRMNNSLRIMSVLGIGLVLGAILIIAFDLSSAAPLPTKDPTPPPLDTDGKNTSTGTPGGSNNGTVIRPNPLPSDTPTTCYKYQWSDSFKAAIGGIASQSTAYQLTTAKNLCLQKGYSEAVAVLAFPADASYATDELYYSCYKIITVSCT